MVQQAVEAVAAAEEQGRWLEEALQQEVAEHPLEGQVVDLGVQEQSRDGGRPHDRRHQLLKPYQTDHLGTDGHPG